MESGEYRGEKLMGKKKGKWREKENLTEENWSFQKEILKI